MGNRVALRNHNRHQLALSALLALSAVPIQTAHSQAQVLGCGEASRTDLETALSLAGAPEGHALPRQLQSRWCTGRLDPCCEQGLRHYLGEARGDFLVAWRELHKIIPILNAWQTRRSAARVPSPHSLGSLSRKLTSQRPWRLSCSRLCEGFVGSRVVGAEALCGLSAKCRVTPATLSSVGILLAWKNYLEQDAGSSPALVGGTRRL